VAGPAPSPSSHQSPHEQEEDRSGNRKGHQPPEHDDLPACGGLLAGDPLPDPRAEFLGYRNRPCFPGQQAKAARLVHLRPTRRVGGDQAIHFLPLAVRQAFVDVLLDAVDEPVTRSHGFSSSIFISSFRARNSRTFRVLTSVLVISEISAMGSPSK